MSFLTALHCRVPAIVLALGLLSGCVRFSQPAQVAPESSQVTGKTDEDDPLSDFREFYGNEITRMENESSGISLPFAKAVFTSVLFLNLAVFAWKPLPTEKKAQGILQPPPVAVATTDSPSAQGGSLIDRDGEEQHIEIRKHSEQLESISMGDRNSLDFVMLVKRFAHNASELWGLLVVPVTALVAFEVMDRERKHTNESLFARAFKRIEENRSIRIHVRRYGTRLPLNSYLTRKGTGHKGRLKIETDRFIAQRGRQNIQSPSVDRLTVYELHPAFSDYSNGQLELTKWKSDVPMYLVGKERLPEGEEDVLTVLGPTDLKSPDSIDELRFLAQFTESSLKGEQARTLNAQTEMTSEQQELNRMKIQLMLGHSQDLSPDEVNNLSDHVIEEKIRSLPFDTAALAAFFSILRE